MSKAKTISKTKPKSVSASSKSASAVKPWWLIGGLVVLIVMVAVYLLQRKPLAESAAPAEITVQQGYDLFKNGAYLLDVRTPEEWNEFHVDGSTLIPLDQLAQRVNEIPKDRQVVVVCRSGNRSQQGRDILRSAGLADTTSMSGGLNEWRAAGYPTISGP